MKNNGGKRWRGRCKTWVGDDLKVMTSPKNLVEATNPSPKFEHLESFPQKYTRI